MNLEEKLQNLSSKERIYLYLAIPIFVFLIYFNFIYKGLIEEHQKLIKQDKEVQKKLSDISVKIRKVKKSKYLLKPTRLKLENLKEDYKYVKYNFDTLDLVHLNDNDVYKIFTQLLQESNKLKLQNSFEIVWNKTKYPPYNQVIDIKIVGSGNYVNILKFLQFVDYIPNIIIVSDAKVAIDLSNEDILKLILDKTKKISNSLSFVLTKYTDSTLQYFKGLAKQNMVDLSISLDSKNANYLDISFKGDYAPIKSILRRIKFDSSRKKKDYEFKELRASLKSPSKKDKLQSQQFTITLKIVGVK